MEQSECNPQENEIGPGLSEEDIRNAIVKSGYPLQTTISDLIRSKWSEEDVAFNVQEEWSFVDSDTKELRALDMLAELPLHARNPQPRVRPVLSLLIECKQSDLPYVFFQTGKARHLLDFPAVAGLHSDRIKVTSDDDASSWTYTIPHVLDLSEDEFYKADSTSRIFSKCARKGSKVVLTGSEPYNGLVLPLAKATKHFKHSQYPPETAWYFDCHLVLAVAVLDAPMIVVVPGESNQTLTATPWVRVLRHEYDGEAEGFGRNQHQVIDVVHAAFMDAYLDSHVLPFAKRFAQRVLRHPTELATGEAFVPGMGKDPWSNVESRLEPLSRKARASRLAAVGRNLCRLLPGTRKK